MKNEELAAQVSALHIQPGTVVVLSLNLDADNFEIAKAMAEQLRHAVPQENPLLVLQRPAEIQALDEVQMRELGWVPQSAVDELVAATEHIIDNAAEVEWDYYGLPGHEDFNPKEALDSARSAIAAVKGSQSETPL